MKWKKTALIIINAIIIIIISILNEVVLSSSKILKWNNYYFGVIASSLLFALLGFFITNRTVVLFSNKIKPNIAQLIAGLVVLAIGMIPTIEWTYLLGFGSLFYNPSPINLLRTVLQSVYANHAINILAGVTIANSLSTTED